ncbi:unnamed protein product [Tetraodon nigroviridis]|uniref:Chromosome 16 SCAF14974, whole genome shotgun sequence n=1 Tax=Tetraodon nigroviridis TaxID=99883 RepID=Q4RZ20_TETNG|nr:unnamed protein product [Tetraodon nigroviridis]
MILFIKIIICFYLNAVVQSQQTLWLPCKFADEREVKKSDGGSEIEFVSREAVLQFGKEGDAPVISHAITFLVTGSKLNLQKYTQGVGPDQVECGLHWHKVQDVHVRWPVQQPNEFSNWLICTMKHTNGDFILTSFLRYPTDQPPPPGSRIWPAISDKQIVTTTAVMMMKSQTPLVTSNLGGQKKLHCQFAIDHKGPNFSLEWHKRGVDLKGLAGGDASYNLPFTKVSNEGMYVCSVSVAPLSASLDISLHIQESPRVSLSVGPTLSLQVDEEKKVVCDAERYYPLDVEVVWYKQDPAVPGQMAGSLLPTAIPNTLLSSHRHNTDKTYSLSSFFYLTASPSDSGKQFTCRVSHKSLKVDIKKSFILTVEEPSSWFFVFSMLVFIVILLLVLAPMLKYLYKAKRKTAQKKPY